MERPSTVVSDWKSNAQSTFGRIEYVATNMRADPGQPFLASLVGDSQAFEAPQASDPPVVHSPLGL